MAQMLKNPTLATDPDFIKRVQDLEAAFLEDKEIEYFSKKGYATRFHPLIFWTFFHCGYGLASVITIFGSLNLAFWAWIGFILATIITIWLPYKK